MYIYIHTSVRISISVCHLPFSGTLLYLSINSLLADLYRQSQGAHGNLDGMGQRRPIHVAVKTYLHQFFKLHSAESL